MRWRAAQLSSDERTDFQTLVAMHLRHPQVKHHAIETALGEEAEDRYSGVRDYLPRSNPHARVMKKRSTVKAFSNPPLQSLVAVHNLAGFV